MTRSIKIKPPFKLATTQFLIGIIMAAISQSILVMVLAIALAIPMIAFEIVAMENSNYGK